MATAPTAELIEELEVRESEGAVVGMRRKYLVDDLTSEGNFTTLAEAVSPEIIPDAFEIPDFYPNLILIDRRIEPAGDSPTQAYVICEYVSRNEAGINSVETGSNLKQLSAAADIFGLPHSVQHTYNTSHSAFPGQTHTQGVNITRNEAAMYVRFNRRLIKTSIPHVISQRHNARVNSENWFDGTPGQWLCTFIQGEPINYATSPYTWAFSAQFEWSRLGHGNLGVFIDPTTGEPPPDVVDGVGIIRPASYFSLDFNIHFPVDEGIGAGAIS